jgi:GAF domain-containing protein
MKVFFRALTWFYAVRYPYKNPADKRRARLLLVLNLMLFAVTDIVLLARYWDTSQPLGENADLLIPGIYLALIISDFLVQSGRLRSASVLMTLMIFAIVTVLMMVVGVDRGILAGYIVVIVMTSALLSTTGLVIMTGAVTVSIVIVNELQQKGTLETATTDTMSVQLAVFGLVIGAAFLWYISSDRDTALREALAGQRRLSAAYLVGQTSTRSLDLDTILYQAVDQIREQFDLYHVHIFLVDERGKYAVFAAGTGEIGEHLLDRRFRIAVGSRSIVGQVSSTDEPMVSPDTRSDPIYRPNDLLPDTRSELTLPLRIGDRVIGVLDLQSAEVNGLTEADIGVAQVMANQLASAIENARLFAEQQQRAAENERLLRESEANLREIERLNRQLTRQVWQEYLEMRGEKVIGITFQENQPRVDTAWTPAMNRAMEEKNPVMSQQGDQQIVAVPVFLRDEVIGAIEIEGTRDFSADESLEITLAVADRLSLTIDNVRLLEHSRQLADRELRVGAISAELQRHNTIDEILSTAVAELGQTLGAEHAAIRLGWRPTDVQVLADNGPDNPQAS